VRTSIRLSERSISFRFLELWSFGALELFPFFLTAASTIVFERFPSATVGCTVGLILTISTVDG